MYNNMSLKKINIKHLPTPLVNVHTHTAMYVKTKWGKKTYRLYSSVLDLNITMVPPSHFSCETLCDDSLLVTWMINGMFLRQLGNHLSVRTETDYPLQCDSGSQGSATYTSTLQVLSDTDTPLPVPYAVQCVAVATCNHGDETTPCTPKICYSHHIMHAEGTYH